MSPRVLLLALLAGAVLATGAVAAAGQSAPSGPQILRSSDGIAGRTVISWMAPFAQFQDERASRSDCSRGQRPVMLFVPAATGSNDRVDCTVPLGRPVMVSPAAYLCVAPNRGLCTDTGRINDVRGVRLAIDGVPVTIRQFDWVSRQAFTLDGAPGAVGGYGYIISGLSAGRHTIATSASLALDPGPGRVRLRMTATITVR